MTTAHPDPAQHVERELTNYQRNLVDTCFEEGNYDSAVALLDSLKNPIVKPYLAHIRNLVYLALYPPPSAEDDHRVSRMDPIPSSPSKYASRHQRMVHVPTPATAEAAVRLLMGYARTNAPASLARALPHYGVSDLRGLPISLPVLEATDDDNDSEIDKYARRVRDAKNCWEILREGFVKPAGQGGDVAAPRTRTSRHGQRTDESDGEDSPSDVPAPVAPHAWPVLDWLLAVFEKDEAATASHDQPRYSPLLLSQLPPSRSPSGSRWDVEAPLDIVLCCLQQPRPENRLMAGRLLSLIINLTGTVFVDLTMILNAVSSRTAGLSPDNLQRLLDAVPSSRTANRFKVALCRHGLVDTSSAGGRRARPKPQARGAPRPTARAAEPPSAAEAEAPAAEPKQETVRRPFATLPATDVLELLRSPGKATTAELTYQLKLNLVAAYAELQQQLGPNEVDTAWQDVKDSGELKAVIDALPEMHEEIPLIRTLRMALDLKLWGLTPQPA